jgi:menaquinone-dependent protoporphyrinogen IX oxidase
MTSPAWSFLASVNTLTLTTTMIVEDAAPVTAALKGIARIVIASPIPYHHKRNIVQTGQTYTKKSQLLIVRDWLR